MERGKTRLHRRECVGIGCGEEGVDVVAAQRSVVIEVDQFGADCAGEVREGAEVIERRGDLRATAEAVAHHAVDPGRMCRAGVDDAGDLLVERAGPGVVRIACVEMVERGAAPRDRLRGGEAGLVRGVVRGEEEVGFGQVLDVDEGIGGGDAVADAGGVEAVLAPFPIGVDRVAGGGELRLAGGQARFRRVGLGGIAHAQAVAAGFGAVDARGDWLADERVPIGRFVACA